GGIPDALRCAGASRRGYAIVVPGATWPILAWYVLSRLGSAMRLRHLGHRVHTRWPTLRRAAPRCALALLTGCRSAATPYNSTPGPCSTRSAALARQVMEDSAHEITNRP